MNTRLFKLRDLGWLARLGIAGLVITMIGGTIASGVYLSMHHGDRDQREGLTIDDVKAHYHGIVSPSPLLESLKSGHPETLEDRDRQILVDWLEGDTATLSLSYDDLDLGADAPAEIIAINCLDCHARSSSGQVDGPEGKQDTAPEIPLEYWDDVYALAISTDIRPVEAEILALSTHTHALGMASMGIAIGLLALLTSWPRVATSFVLCATGVGLAADIGGWWLTRHDDLYAPVVVVGGLLFSGGICLLSVMILLDLCMPRSKDMQHDEPEIEDPFAA
ncbi:MAG: hypothetical protein AAFN41_13720 [Planctomycetota bacterium]